MGWWSAISFEDCTNCICVKSLNTGTSIVLDMVIDHGAKMVCEDSICILTRLQRPLVSALRIVKPVITLFICYLTTFPLLLQASQIQITTSSCTYPSSPALGLGFTAALALLVAQIIISTTTGCFCCRRGPYQANSNRTLAVICFVVSW